MTNERGIEMTPVPPPKAVPVQDLAETLLLLPGLRVEENRGPFRCASCNKLKDRLLVWVPDGLRIGDNPALVTETCRLSAYNGHRSGWCLECAQSLCPPPKAYKPKRRWLLQRILAKMARIIGRAE